MKLKYLFLFGIAILFLASVSAQNIEYPISELGNCGSQQECEEYCDINENIEKCVDFAKKWDLMSEEELEKAEKVLPLMVSGETPGNCKSEKACERYCSKKRNIEECVDFAKRAGILSDEEAELVRAANGEGPGGCKGPQECAEYCGSDENIIECAEFAYNHGLLNEEEYEAFKKTKGKGPNGCESPEECDEYCEENRFKCLQWALDKDMMTIEEAIEGKSERGKCQMRCFIEKDYDPEKCQKSEGKKEMPTGVCLLCEQQCSSKEGDKKDPGSSDDVNCVKECLLEKGIEMENIIEDNVDKEDRLECSETCGLKKSGEGEKDFDDKEKPEEGEKTDMGDKEAPPEEHDKEGDESDDESETEEGEEETEEETESDEESESSEETEEQTESDTVDSPETEEAESDTVDSPETEEAESDTVDSPEDTTDEGGDSPITGETVREYSGENIFGRILDWVKNLM